jgi:multiple antibiotic resistance protein
MNQELLLFFVGSFVSLFSMVDPPMAAPVFVSLTQQMTAAEQKALAWRTTLCVFAIMLVFLLAGGVILSFFGISIDALRIAGGLMILGSAYSMLEKPSRISEQEAKEAESKEDIAFSPLAMPLLSGPGSIAVLIGMTTDAKDWLHYAAIFLVIVLVSLTCYLTLRISSRIVSALGETTVKSFSRIMGFILLCIGVQYLVNGVKPILASLVPMR